MAGALAGTLLIDIATDIAKLKQGFSEAQNVIQGFGRSVDRIGSMFKGAMAAFGVGVSLQGLKSLADSVGAIGEQAEAVGLSARDFQAFSLALQQAGLRGEQATQLLGKGAKSLGEALEGNKEKVEALRGLGITAVGDYSEAIPKIAQAILKIEDPLKRAAAVTAIFGKSGQGALPAMQALAQGADALAASFAGGIVSDETIKKFDDFMDGLSLMSKFATVGIAEAISGWFPPAVVDSAKKLGEEISNVWHEANLLMKEMLGFSVNDVIVTAIQVLITNFRLLTAAVKAVIDLVKMIPGAIDAVIDFGKDTYRKAADAINRTFTTTTPLSEGIRGRTPEEQAKLDAAARADQQKSAIAAAERLRASNAARFGPTLLAPFPSMPEPPKPEQTLTAKGSGGVDKFAEAMKKLREETRLTQEAIVEFNRLTAAGEGGKEAGRQAKLLQDIGKARADILKDIPAGIDPKPIQDMAEALVKLKFNLDELKESQKVADEVHKKFGDGTIELKDRIDELNKAYVEGRIKAEEYKAAIEEAEKAQRKQKISVEENKEGWDGFVAGMQNAQMQLEEYVKASNQGSMLIMNVWNLASDALSEFITTGEFNFKKLAAGFAKMLADMVAKWLVAQAILAGLRLIGAAAGGGSITTGAPGPAPVMSGGMMASGGFVTPGRSFLVGERGPETFVPSTSGRIEPNKDKMSVIINNNAAGVTVGAEQTSDGNLAITVDRVKRALSRDVARGGNLFSQSLERTYGMSRGGA